MSQVLSALVSGPIPQLLVIAAIAFFFFGVGGQLGAKIITDKIRPAPAYIVGDPFFDFWNGPSIWARYL